MCLGGGGSPAPAPAPPLPPPPPVPPAPPAPLPVPEPLEQEVNPSVRRAKSKKSQGEYAQGSAQLRVDRKKQGLSSAINKLGIGQGQQGLNK